MNTDIRVDVGFLDHWKTDTLIAELGDAAVLSLMRIWIFAAQNKTDGRLTGINDSTIERIAKWKGPPGALTKLLDELRFIEKDESGVWALHDWERHNPYAASAEFRHERAKKANAARREKEKKHDCRLEHASSALEACYEPAPSPSPAPSPAPSPETFQVKVTKSSSVRGGVGEIQKTTDDRQDFFELTPGRLRTARDRGFTDEAWLRAETEKFINRNQGQSIKDPDRAWLAWLEAGRRMGIAIRDKPFVGRKPDSSGYVSRGAVL